MLNNLTSFIDNCKSYFNSKNEIYILKDMFTKKLTIINAEIQINEINKGDENYIYAKKYLEHKKAALICEFDVLQYIINDRIEFDCNKLNSKIPIQSIQPPIQQSIQPPIQPPIQLDINPSVKPYKLHNIEDIIGGYNDNDNENENISHTEHKIHKYLHKMSNSNNSEKTNTYMHLLNKHIQNGGEIMIDNTVLMNNILNNNYNLLTDIEKYKNTKERNIDSSNEDCIKNNYDDEDIDIIQPKSKYFNTKYLCINADTRYSKNYRESKYNYELRRSLKSKATDIFMDSVLNTGLKYNMLCNYAHFELSSFFYEFIYKYNLNIKDKTKRLGENDIILLYKGGNTTRMHIGLLLKNLKKDNQLLEFTELENIYGELTLGDWDFNVNIHFHKLILKGYTRDELINLINQCKQISVLGLYKLKMTFNKLLDGSLSESYADRMLSDFGNGVERILSDYDNNINSLNSKETIIKTNIGEVNVYNYKIEYNDKGKGKGRSIKEKFDNKKLFKESYIITDKPVIINPSSNGKKQTENIYTTRKNVDSVVTFFSNNNLTEFIPHNMFEFNNLHIVYSDMLFFMRHKTMINFSLFRLKFNNKMILEINKENKDVSKSVDGQIDRPIDGQIDGPTDRSNKNCINSENKKCELIKIPIEIVDLSVLSIDDNRQDFDHIFFQTRKDGTYNKYQEINYSISDNLSEDTRDNKTTPLSYNLSTYIPSANYMFYDIAEMLLADNMFIWDDKKYEKRIARIIYLSVICELSDNKTITELISDYTQFKTFIERYNNKADYDEDNIIDKIYGEIKAEKKEGGNPMVVINNDQMIIPAINKIKPTKLLRLQNKKINFFIDTFISNYNESIILIKYFKDTYLSVASSTTGSKLTDEHLKYCQFQNELLELIKNKKIIKHKMVDGKEYNATVDYNGINYYKDPKQLNKMIKKLFEYKTYLLKYINKIISILTDISQKRIDRIDNFDWSATKLY